MGKSLFMIAIVGLLFSCQYNDVIQGNTFRAGTYKGRLSIIYPVIDYAPMTVTLTFTADRFSIEGHDAIYPSNVIPPTVCNQGTYKITDREIEFTTDCVEPAGLSSWFAAINGKFQMKVDGRHLEIDNASSTGVRYAAVTYNLTLQ